MDRTRALLEAVAAGRISPDEAALSLKEAPFEDLGYAKVDHHRSLRQGAQEVIYGAGKTVSQLLGILKSMGQRGCTNIIITRLPKENADILAQTVPLSYHEAPRLAIAYPKEQELTGSVVVATGGTSDIPVAEEAAITLEALGSRAIRLYDVGVAGIHRLLSNLEPVMSARAIVAVAGMEGALASVLGGLAECPVIAVPTSVGYGASFGGLAALLSMLNSCASGVSVVNIDNGFGAGFLAHTINQMKGIDG